MNVAVVSLFASCVNLLQAISFLQEDEYEEVDSCRTYTERGLLVYRVLECARLCSLEETCWSFSIQETFPGQCYLNMDFLPVDDNCVSVLKHYNKAHPCQNGGLYDIATDTCQCFHGYVGSRCERLMQDCSEGFDSGYYTNDEAVFWIHPNTSPNPLRVYCAMVFDGRTYILRNEVNRPTVNFTRTWQDYKTGFGDLENNFYAGNDVIYYVTNNRGMHLKFDVIIDGLILYQQYSYIDFRITDEADNYRFSYSSGFPEGDHELGDCFPAQNLAFSTIDRDNDADRSGSCAQIHQSGWWFNNCGPCNPTGVLQPNSVDYQSGDPEELSLPTQDERAVRKFWLYLVNRS